MMAHLCASVYDNLQNQRSISRRKLAFYLCLQEFPGQTKHPGAGCRRYPRTRKAAKASPVPGKTADALGSSSTVRV